MRIFFTLALFILSGIPFSFASLTTLKGMHDTIGGPQSSGFANLTKKNGHSPAAFSSDFGFSTHPNDDYRKRADLLDKILHLPSTVKLITLSWHQCRPDIQEPCTFGTGVASVNFTDKEWQELLLWNSPLNKMWQKQIKILGEFLQKLQDKKIDIYLRPYHEPNIPNFWWTDIKNPQRSVELYKMLRKHLEEDYKLKNLKWVWSISYHPAYLENLQKFYPGDDFVDVIGVDIYPPKKGVSPDFTHAWTLLNSISKIKPKALTEVSKLPKEDDLKKHDWMYVIPWGENMLKQENTTEEIQAFFK